MIAATFWVCGCGAGQVLAPGIAAKVVPGKVTLTDKAVVVNVALPPAGTVTVPLWVPEVHAAVSAKPLPLVSSQVTPPEAAVMQVPTSAGLQPVCAGLLLPMPLLPSHS